jgi:hypothetical protein
VLSCASDIVAAQSATGERHRQASVQTETAGLNDS